MLECHPATEPVLWQQKQLEMMVLKYLMCRGLPEQYVMTHRVTGIFGLTKLPNYGVDILCNRNTTLVNNFFINLQFDQFPGNSIR